MTKLTAVEARRVALEADLASLAAVARTVTLADHVAVTADLRARCADLQAVLRQNVVQAQALLRDLLPERLTVTKTPAGVRITGAAALGTIVAQVLGSKGMPPG